VLRNKQGGFRSQPWHHKNPAGPDNQTRHGTCHKTGEQKQEGLIRLQVPNIISDELCNRAYFSKYTLKIIRKSYGSPGYVTYLV